VRFFNLCNDENSFFPGIIIMLKKVIFCSVMGISHASLAASFVSLFHEPLSRLDGFLVANKTLKKRSLNQITTSGNELQTVNITRQGNKVVTRYQQIYNGIPVFGAQVTVIKYNQNSFNQRSNPGSVNGHIIEDINLKTIPVITMKQALEKAKNTWFSANSPVATTHDVSELQIRPNHENSLSLVYLVSFKLITSDNKPVWPFFIIDAESGEVLKQWNNIKTFNESGPGGNDKVHEYWYGKDGLPALEVTKSNDMCVMESTKVRLVNLYSKWDWSNKILNPYQYPCGENKEDRVNGAFSPLNDAYYFGHTIIDMYQQWYGLNALQNTDGTAAPLIMRVHFGEGYDNAFWDGDGRTMSFGDGNDFYPLVSLDIAGHEVTHGFTEQHSGLEYHDESGAINESLSDMAGQAARAFLLENNPGLYNKVYLHPDEVTWGIGETIVRDSFGKALRFMDAPSEDGSSADCLDKALAEKSGETCVISYNELVSFAEGHIFDPDSRQSFIVHTASGIFNKAFYLLSQKIGIKKAYNAMVVANSNYWTPDSDFKMAACGVLYAANDLNLNSADVKTVFDKVGVATEDCKI
jgi:vibriolysin